MSPTSEVEDVPVLKPKEYVRLEPVNQDYSLEEGLQARVKDPLWMIGRQWQLGEFRPSNGGRPVRVESRFRTEALDQIALINNNGVVKKEYDYNIKKPLESEVEAEITEIIDGQPKKSSPAWDPSRFEYNFSVKKNNQELMAEKYDGNNLDWYHFYVVKSESIDTPDSSNTMVAKPTPVSYRGMPLPRWWAFEDTRIDLGNVQRPYLNFLTMLLVEFGLTDSNDWYLIPLEQKVGWIRKMESVKVIDSFGVVTQLNPIIDGTVGRQGWEVFTLTNNNSPSANDGSILYIPNNVHYCLESEPFETVSLFRDEMANLVWAIEQKCKDLNGKVVNRNDELKLTCTTCGFCAFDETTLEQHIGNNHGVDLRHYWNTVDNRIISRADYLALDEQIKANYVGPLALYQEKTFVPENWIPYIAVQINPEKGQIMFRRGRTREQPSTEKQFKGEILKESTFIHEENVPRTGLMISRNTQLARGIDGELYAWNGRYKKIDDRRKSSGLQFDSLLK
jgi:hypothetical protein